MTYRNEILVTARDRLPLVSLLPLYPPLFQVSRACLDQIRTEACVLLPELPETERPFAGMLGPGLKHPQGEGGGWDGGG